MSKGIALAVLLTAMATSASAEFKVSFKDWGGIPLYTSGSPNTVGNPEFILSGVPKDTTTIQFKLVDLDVKNFNHGGSKRLKITKDGQVPANTFKYKSPCPPNGKHTYEWTATARKGGKVIGRAKTSRQYP